MATIMTISKPQFNIETSNEAVYNVAAPLLSCTLKTGYRSGEQQDHS